MGGPEPMELAHARAEGMPAGMHRCYHCKQIVPLKHKAANCPHKGRATQGSAVANATKTG